ncbi:hypothetical protein BLA29_004738 [Euroglyphus maynei]|uniref:Uncharacterized protein n=1 Tax=Euroglyphus maynei TaxID=6958 RepID=A0A1Y3BGH9_EURMA|nr:hypothetical protein BLA29_004738 [Euroglyphus maynei]
MFSNRSKKTSNIINFKFVISAIDTLENKFQPNPSKEYLEKKKFEIKFLEKKLKYVLNDDKNGIKSLEDFKKAIKCLQSIQKLKKKIENSQSNVQPSDNKSYNEETSEYSCEQQLEKTQCSEKKAFEEIENLIEKFKNYIYFQDSSECREQPATTTNAIENSRQYSGQQNEGKCLFCDGFHHFYECKINNLDKIIKLSKEDRCYKCFLKDHFSSVTAQNVEI